jgi:hypothetical protein
VSKRTRRAVRLADVAAVAVACGRYRTRFTYPPENLGTAFVSRDGGGEFWACPHCHALVQGEGAGAATGGPFRPLLLALDLLRGLRDRVEVRLVVRREDSCQGE